MRGIPGATKKSEKKKEHCRDVTSDFDPNVTELVVTRGDLWGNRDFKQ